MGLVMSGGHLNTGSGDFTSDKMQRTQDYGVTWEEMVALPKPMYGHCLVIVDENTIFIAGGGPSSKKETYLLDLNTNQWTPGPQMRVDRSFFGCSLFTSSSGETKIALVGGFTKQTDIYDIATKTIAPGTASNRIVKC